MLQSSEDFSLPHNQVFLTLRLLLKCSSVRYSSIFFSCLQNYKTNNTENAFFLACTLRAIITGLPAEENEEKGTEINNYLLAPLL